MSRSDKKVESEIIMDTYAFDDIRMAVYFGDPRLFLEFVSMREALLSRMIHQTFIPENFFVATTVAGRTIVINATGLTFLKAMENMLEEYGWLAQVTVSEGYHQNPTTLKNLGTNIRRIDRIDDAKAVDPNKRNRITIEPREHAEISKGQFGWTEKSWEAFFSDEPIKLGGVGEVQHSNITEDKVRLYTDAITHVIETDILYRNYATMEEKTEAALKAGKTQIERYLGMFDEGLEKMIFKKNQVTRIAGNALVELRSLMRIYRLIEEEDIKLGKRLEEGNIVKYIDKTDGNENYIMRMKEAEEEMDGRYDKLKVQVMHLTRQLEKYDLIFKEQNIEINSIKEDEEIMKAAGIDMEKIDRQKLIKTNEPIIREVITIEPQKVTVKLSPISSLKNKIHDIFYPNQRKDD